MIQVFRTSKPSFRFKITHDAKPTTKTATEETTDANITSKLLPPFWLADAVNSFSSVVKLLSWFGFVALNR
jgi:hypothetical protein